MRRRLTIAILLLVAARWSSPASASYFLIRRAAITTGQHQLNSQAQAISQTFSNADCRHRQSASGEELGVIAGCRCLRRHRRRSRLYPDGSISGRLPPGVTTSMLNIPALRAGQQVTGHTGSLLVYSAVPTPARPGQPASPGAGGHPAGPRPGQRAPVLRPGGGHRPGPGRPGGRRAGPPVHPAPGRGGRRHPPHRLGRPRRHGGARARTRIPEFAQLAESINTMGASLVRARDQERQFLLSVSHELRTPLTSIRGYADAVIDGATDDPAAAALVISAEARPARAPGPGPARPGPAGCRPLLPRPRDGRLRRRGPAGGRRIPAPGRRARARAARCPRVRTCPLWVTPIPTGWPGRGQPAGERGLLRRSTG